MISVLLAVFAAVLFAGAATSQQHAARSTARRRLGVTLPALVATLLRDRWWLLGGAANLAGFAAHAVALRLGSITVVQAVLVAQLLFALPFATLRQRVLPLARDWLGTAAICAGLVVLLTTRGPEVPVAYHRGTVPAVLLVALGTMTALLVAAGWLRRYPQLATALNGTATGTCFSLTAMFVVFAGADLADHGPAGVLGWAVPAVGLSTATSSVLSQRTYAGGSLPAALTAMLVADPVASWLVGVAAFGVAMPAGPAAVFGCVAGGLAVTVGVGLLAYSPTLHEQRVPHEPRPALPAQRSPGCPRHRCCHRAGARVSGRVVDPEQSPGGRVVQQEPVLLVNHANAVADAVHHGGEQTGLPSGLPLGPAQLGGRRRDLAVGGRHHVLHERRAG